MFELDYVTNLIKETFFFLENQKFCGEISFEQTRPKFSLFRFYAELLEFQNPGS